MTTLLNTLAEPMKRALPDIRPGYTVRIHERIKEGEKERTQVFEGLVIGLHRGHGPMDQTMTVRRVISGIAVERIFPLHSPFLEKIDVKKVAQVRRAKLNFLRGRSGKSARLSERFTGAEEFAVAVQGKVEEEQEEAVVGEAAAKEVPEAK